MSTDHSRGLPRRSTDAPPLPAQRLPANRPFPKLPFKEISSEICGGKKISHKRHKKAQNTTKGVLCFLCLLWLIFFPPQSSEVWEYNLIGKKTGAKESFPCT